MIDLRVDECYAFDYLSILEVKAKKTNSYNQYTKCYKYIENQIGESLMTDITQSPEYDTLFMLNRSIFDLIDKVKTDLTIGKEIDRLNYQRYLAKNRLQIRFFKKATEEEKIGYGK